MWDRLITLRRIYREETRFDWCVFAANTVCVILVLAASLHAHGILSFATETLHIASAGF